MPLPAGFKVNGTKMTGSGPIPPRVKKAIALLESLPDSELLTTAELEGKLGLSEGTLTTHARLTFYREKVDNKLFWGSLTSIAKLRKRLAEPEETNDQD